MGRLRGVVAVVLFGVVLLAGVLVAVPVREAVADTSDYGPDGYFSALGAGATPSTYLAYPARPILFGKRGSEGTYDSKRVSGEYNTLGIGPIDSGLADPIGYGSSSGNWATYSTSIRRGDALLFADDVVTGELPFDSREVPTSTFDDKSISYQSNIAKVADDKSESQGVESTNDVAGMNYSTFEQSLLRDDTVEATSTDWSTWDGKTGSTYRYRVFPLSVGDVGAYLGMSGFVVPSVPGLLCNTGEYSNNVIAGWVRSPDPYGPPHAMYTNCNGTLGGYSVATPRTTAGFRPALRLKLGDLLLSAHSGNQSQVLTALDSSSPDSLRLTFVDSGKRVWLSGTPTVEQEPDGGDWVLQGVGGSSNLQSQSGFGWKLVDPEDTSGAVVASGRTNYDAAAGSDGNMVVPCETLTPGRDYLLSVWGQEDGSDVVGWSNRATMPVTGTVRADGAGGCGPLDMPVAEPFGIALTGETLGTLTAYRIGEYDETLFTQTGALKSVRLDTPEDLGTVLKNAAETAGGSDVDAGNPIGWVASHWLGYPTDPSSDDVTSAFSPYAGKLQLFARALADRVSADGDAVLGGVQGSLHGLDAPVASPVTLPLSDEGLYLIVDSTGTSLPIIVGTKVFNDALGDDGGFVDFADAGVKGKPRLGQAALKTTVTDIAKRIVNDAGLDGFDVGSQVEFEVALRVPDLSSFTSVAYDSYVFDVADVVASGLTLPAGGSGVEVFVDALSPTQPQSLPSSSITVSGDTLSVDGLKALFAESSGSGVRNKDSVSAGSLMRLRYTAVLNASAVVSSPVEGDSLKPNVNAVTLTRSYTGGVTAGWTDNSDGTESRSATANAYTFKVDVVKLDKDDLSTKLGGVGFEVSRDGQKLKFTKLSDGEYRLGDASGTEVVVTKSDGTLSLQGVEARELSFKETNAPSGYFKVSDFTVDVRPVWNEDATQVTKVTYATSGTNLAYVSQDGRQVVVLDPAWSLANLPYTGGIGILALLVVGGLMLVFAVRPYVLSKRAERDANLV